MVRTVLRVLFLGAIWGPIAAFATERIPKIVADTAFETVAFYDVAPFDIHKEFFCGTPYGQPNMKIAFEAVHGEDGLRVISKNSRHNPYEDEGYCRYTSESNGNSKNRGLLHHFDCKGYQDEFVFWPYSNDRSHLQVDAHSAGSSGYSLTFGFQGKLVRRFARDLDLYCSQEPSFERAEVILD